MALLLRPLYKTLKNRLRQYEIIYGLLSMIGSRLQWFQTTGWQNKGRKN
jgi:hypothetical protein